MFLKFLFKFLKASFTIRPLAANTFAQSAARRIATSMAAVVVASSIMVAAPQPADAVKKGKNDAAAAEAEAKAALEKEEAELKKVIDPLDKTLTDLMRKYDSRQLFSPSDAGKLSDAKYTMMDLMNQYPKSPLIAKPLFQTGFLLAERGKYDEAYELLNFLNTQQPQNPYGAKARVRLYQLQKRLGAEYFQALEAASAGSGSATGQDAGADGKGGEKTTPPPKK
ncbi:MAG: hypothetical protein VKJ04_09210 [Vampirovibrionales bacterium]|nr:hypothetical protein [Vampirovibrionales bacterium]